MRSSDHQCFQQSVSDVRDTLQLGECSALKSSGHTLKRNCRKNIRQCNYLEIIPETCTTSLREIDTNNNSVQTDNSINLNYEFEEDINSKSDQAESSTTSLSGNIELSQRTSNRNSLYQAQTNQFNDILSYSRPLRSDEENASVSSLPPDKSLASKRSVEQNRKSLQTTSELKSGVLVWISPMNGVRNKSNKISVMNKNINSIDSNVSKRTSLRIPIMLKVYRGSSGSFALMTPSRSYQGQAQPLYLRLKNTHVTMIDTASLPILSRSSGPCCFLLTLCGQEGKSFKFEASSITAAEEWVHVLNGNTNIAAKIGNMSISMANTTLLRGLKTEDGNNTWYSTTSDHINLNDDNNGKKTSNDLVINVSIIADTFSPLSAPTRTNKNVTDQHRLLQISQTRPYFVAASNHHLPLSGFQRERQMPTLSESSDENEEDLSEED